MKKVLKSFIFMGLLLIPFGVLSAPVGAPTFSLNCAATAKKGETVNCSLTATLADGETSTLTTVDANYSIDSKFTSGTGTIDKNDLDITTTGEIDNFSIVAGTTAGDGVVTVTITGATDGTDSFISDNVVVTDTVKILNNDTSITSIKTNDEINTTCKFDQSSCDLSTNKSTYKIEVGVASSATVTSAATLNTGCGTTTHKVTITAEDATTRDYTFNINRSCDTNTTLKGITISTGSLNPTFSSTVKSYRVEVSSDIDKITIVGTKAVSSQTISGEVKDRALQYGDNKYTLTVNSESDAQGTYTIVVNRKDDRSTNNLLKSIKLSEGKLTPEFSKNVGEYKVRVLHSVEKIKVTAEAEHNKATITYDGNEKQLVDGKNNILVKVKSENQTEKIYTIVVERLKEGETLGDNPNLSNISVKDYDLGFSYAKDSYTLKIEKEDKLDITAITEESTSTYTIRGNKDLKNGSVITIKVTSADGTTKDYTITIEKSNTMLFIIIAGVTLLVAIGLVVYLLIKNKKDKDSLTTTKVKNQLKKDDEILAKVQSQLNQTEKQMENTITPTTPITPVSINLESYKEEPKEVEPIPVYRDEPVEGQESKIVEVVEKPQQEETRVCSICGHRVSAELKTCPYCKRSF